MNGYIIKRTKKVQPAKFEWREREREHDRKRAQYRAARAQKRGDYASQSE